MVLPTWTDEMSDGCSVPKALLLVRPDIATACVVCRSCCVQHDRAYYYGGTMGEKLTADYELFRCMAPIVGEEIALVFFKAVRVFGGPHWDQLLAWSGVPLTVETA